MLHEMGIHCIPKPTTNKCATPLQVLTKRIWFLLGWRPKVADVDINNQPVPGPLTPSHNLLQHMAGEMILLISCFTNKYGLEQRNYWGHTQCWASWSGKIRALCILLSTDVLLWGLQRKKVILGAKMKCKEPNVVLTWQVTSWLMMTKLLRPYWTTSFSC